MNKKGLEEMRADLKAQMEDLLNNSKAEERALNEDEVSKFDELEKEINNIDATIEREEKINNMEEKVTKTEENELTVEERELKEFAGFIRSQMENRTDPTNLTKGDNGAVIPTTIANKIIAKLEEISPIYARATKYKAKGTLVIPKVDTSTDDITVGYATEFSDLISRSNKFDSVSLSGFLIGALTKVSKSLLNNSDFDLVQFVVDRMAEKMSVFYENELLNGTENKVSGVVGSYDSTNMKVTLDKKSTITADELIDIQELVIDAYQGNACWIMNRATRKAIRKLKDGQGMYLLNQVFGQAWDYELLGKPVYCSDNITALGTASKPVIVYGDLSGLAVKETGEIEFQVLNELFAVQHAVGVCAYSELDAKVENTQKIAVAVSGSAD